MNSFQKGLIQGAITGIIVFGAVLYFGFLK